MKLKFNDNWEKHVYILGDLPVDTEKDAILKLTDGTTVEARSKPYISTWHGFDRSVDVTNYEWFVDIKNSGIIFNTSAMELDIDSVVEYMPIDSRLARSIAKVNSVTLPERRKLLVDMDWNFIDCDTIKSTPSGNYWEKYGNTITENPKTGRIEQCYFKKMEYYICEFK